MSLAGAADPDADHLAALKRLVDRFEPALVSEHLAWSRLDGRCFPDLLPVPRTNQALDACAANIGRVQDALGRQILIENPTHYLDLREHSWSETSFPAELARRTGCGLLIDVNNVAVGAHNLGFDPSAGSDAIPAERVGEIHLAGHSLDAEGTLLIDSHDAPVSEDVWQLYEGFVARIGPRPTLIERDGNIPPFAELMREREPRPIALLDGSWPLQPDLLDFQRDFAAALDAPGDGRDGGLSQHRPARRGRSVARQLSRRRADRRQRNVRGGRGRFRDRMPAAVARPRALRRALRRLARRAGLDRPTCLICPTSRGSSGCMSRACSPPTPTRRLIASDREHRRSARPASPPSSRRFVSPGCRRRP